MSNDNVRARGRTNDPKEEEKGDETWRQYRDHGLNRSAECTHRKPRHHPVNYEARTTIARENVVRRCSYVAYLREHTID